MPKIRPRPQVNQTKLLAEERRQEHMDQQLADAANNTGSVRGSRLGTGTKSPSAAGGAVSVGHGASGDLSGRAIVSLVRAQFPRTAAGRHALGWEGTVVAALKVAPDGQVAQVQILRSSGDPDVDAAAQRAFRSWRFSPLPSGAPLAVQVGEVRMRFVLK